MIMMLVLSYRDILSTGFAIFRPPTVPSSVDQGKNSRALRPLRRAVQAVVCLSTVWLD